MLVMNNDVNYRLIDMLEIVTYLPVVSRVFAHEVAKLNGGESKKNQLS